MTLTDLNPPHFPPPYSYFLPPPSSSSSSSSSPLLPFLLSVTMNSEGKPPTRLQKQAPATLQFNNELWNSSKTVIPLLSPLVLSPAPLPDATGQTQTQNSFLPPNNSNHEAKMNREIAIGIIPQLQQSSGGGASSSGWRHPAMAGQMPDAYFQSQCVLLPRKQ